MPVSEQTILVAFDALGLRNTRPRRLIASRLASISTKGADFTTEDLWHELNREDSRVGRATVYRAVEALTDLGLVDRIAFANGSHRYRVCAAGKGHHHHVVCDQCDRVVEIEECLPPQMLTAIENTTNFKLDTHSLELYGLCEECSTASR